MSKRITPAGPRSAPVKMLSELSHAGTLMWIGVALLIHVVVFGATSVNYLRAAFNPGAAESQPAEGDAAAPASASSSPASGSAAPVATPASGVAASPKAAAAEVKSPEPTDEAKMLEAHKDSPVVKAITEPAKPGDLPKGPSHNGLDLDTLDAK